MMLTRELIRGVFEKLATIKPQSAAEAREHMQSTEEARLVLDTPVLEVLKRVTLGDVLDAMVTDET